MARRRTGQLAKEAGAKVKVKVKDKAQGKRHQTGAAVRSRL